MCNVGGAEPRRSNVGAGREIAKGNSTKQKSDFGFPTIDVPRPVPKIPKLSLCAALAVDVDDGEDEPKVQYVGEQGPAWGQGKEGDRVKFNATE